MDPKDRRKLTKALSDLIELSEAVIEPGKPIQKLGGQGFLAWLYRPSGEGSETIHVELRIGSKWNADEKVAA